MRAVHVLGIGQTSVGEHWERPLKDLAGEAAFAALGDAGVERLDGVFVGNMLSPTLNRQMHLGALIADWIGLRGVEAVKIESACGSGGSAVRAALLAIASGEMQTALVVGVEKMTDTPGHETTAALATAADADEEADHGVSFVALNAFLMRRYMHEYGWTHQDFAPFSVNAHANAVSNPWARLREPITAEDYARARMIADPINLLDASPIGDGAAAVVLAADGAPRDRAKIRFAASAVATDSIAVHNRRDPLWLSAAERSAAAAYRQAGIQTSDIDLFELHDAFSIMAVLSLEACGFCERGQGPRLGLEDQIGVAGRIPVATRGGLKARGHPVGATGVYQIVEAVQQLRGEAGSTQVDGARVAMAQNIGGSGATVVTHILERE
ncbi:MAG TPA: thiolase domain-containing protein [Anaerolineales bacterium]|nr:thiolase domain-containing protein [Anaerolineales bacterium]